MYEAKCGFIDKEETEPRKAEIVCNMVGCRDCKHFNGEEYYPGNVKKGVAMWAKLELERMRGSENKEDSIK